MTKEGRLLGRIALVALGVFVPAAASAPAQATPPDGQIFFARDGILDARATPELCQSIQDLTGVDVSHLTLCNLRSPKCQQIDGETIQGLAVLTCPKVTQVTAPSAATGPSAPAETGVALNAVTMSTNLRYAVDGSADVDAIYCKSFGGAVGSRACRKIEADAAALCADDGLIVNRRLTEAQCTALEGILSAIGARDPVVDFAIIEDFDAIGAPGETAVGVCGSGITVQCVPSRLPGAEGVDFKDIISVQWNQTETCTYITLDGTRLRRC